MTDKLQALREQLALASRTAESVEDLLMNMNLLIQSGAYQSPGKRPRLSSVVSNPPGQAIESSGQLKEEDSSSMNEDEIQEDSSSMNEDESEEARYLVVSSGCAICFLDLKKRDGVPIHHSLGSPTLGLPKIATLNLIESRLPVAVGLFRRGSEIYMIGGQDFPTDVKPPPFFFRESYGDFNLFRFFLECGEGGIKRTSCATRRLSVVNGAVCLSECEIGELKSPKFWPKVERIGEKLHVFEHCPFSGLFHAKDWVFSHEVLDLGAGADTSCWRKIEATQAVDAMINSYLVVGNRIYAVASGKCLVFCSETEKWEEVERDERERTALNAERVWDIIKWGEAAMCVGKFELQENTGDDLYVVIAIVEHREERGEYGRGYYHYNKGDDVGSSGSGLADGVHAVAYLVTSKGVVVCRQMVPQMFKGRVVTHSIESSKVIKVDEEGKTMCVIVSGYGHDLGGADLECLLFIYTFTVEMQTHKREVQELLCKPGRFYADVEFMRVKIKDRYVHDPVGDKGRNEDEGVREDETFEGDPEEYQKWYEGRMRDAVKEEADFKILFGIDACFGWIPS